MYIDSDSATFSRLRWGQLQVARAARFIALANSPNRINQLQLHQIGNVEKLLNLSARAYLNIPAFKMKAQT